MALKQLQCMHTCIQVFGGLVPILVKTINKSFIFSSINLRLQSIIDYLEPDDHECFCLCPFPCQVLEETVQQKVGGASKPIEDMTLDELDELEDEEDERVLLQYR